MNPATSQTVCQILLCIGIVITGFAGFGSYHYGKKAAAVKDKELINSLEQQVKPFIQLATEKYPGIEQSKALAKLKEDIGKIKAKMAPRTLDPQQRKTIVEGLKSQEKKTFTILAVQGDQEAFEFAQILRAAIVDAGYGVDDVGLAANIPFRGLRISVGTKPAPECAAVLAKTLLDEGLQVYRIYEPNQELNTVNIIVGSRP